MPRLNWGSIQAAILTLSSGAKLAEHAPQSRAEAKNITPAYPSPQTFSVMSIMEAMKCKNTTLLNMCYLDAIFLQVRWCYYIYSSSYLLMFQQIPLQSYMIMSLWQPATLLYTSTHLQVCAAKLKLPYWFQCCQFIDYLIL
jgi:hypothetical protein